MFSAQAQSLQNLINNLQESSKKFIEALSSNNLAKMEESSSLGVKSLDSIVNMLIRFRDDSKKYELFNQPSIGMLFNDNINLSLLEQLSKLKGDALTNSSYVVPDSSSLLNKIKHASFNPGFSTFEIKNSKHILHLAGDFDSAKKVTKPYILSFNVFEFCKFISVYINELDKYYKNT